MACRRTMLIAVLLALDAARAFAQTAEGAPDPAKVRIRLGPLWMNPSLSLTNAGIDTNVFNDPDSVTPKRDFNITVTPQSDLWLRIGPTWLNGTIREQIVYYKKYASERSANTSYRVGWRIPLNRLSFNLNANYLKTHERPGFEIDARAARGEHGYDGTMEVRMLAKTFVGVRGEERRVKFEEGARFLGTDLHEQLNRTTTTGGLIVRHQLTPLTGLTFEASRQQDRFEGSTLRDSNSTLISGGLRFDPFALLKGGATFGFRHFKPLSPDVPSFKGTAMAVDLTYTALGTTRFGIQAARDVQYSYDVNQPYYLQTGVGGSIAQQIFGPLDVVLRLGAQRLEYRDRAGATVLLGNRTDTVTSYGVGVGYHFGTDLRFGVNVDKQKRKSGLANRRFDGLKFGTSITYGL